MHRRFKNRNGIYGKRKWRIMGEGEGKGFKIFLENKFNRVKKRGSSIFMRVGAFTKGEATDSTDMKVERKTNNLIIGKVVEQLKSLSKVVLILGIVAYSSSARGKDCIWVEGVGEAVVENITGEEARQLALMRARNDALNKLGIHVKTITYDIRVESKESLQLFGIYASLMGSGLFLKESVSYDVKEIFTKSETETSEALPLILYVAKTRSCVVVLTERDRDATFQVFASMPKQIFKEGEGAKIEVRCSKDCYVNIFNLIYDGTVSLIFPSKLQKGNFLEKDKILHFPKEGLKLEMTTGDNGKEKESENKKKRVLEAFLILATKKDYQFKEKMEFSEFQSYLSKIPFNDWTEELVPYEVSK